MRLLLVRHLWGLPADSDWASLFPAFSDLGYGAVEAPLPESSAARRFHALLAREKLGFIPQIFTEGATVADHIRSFRRQVETARRSDPILVNAHSGRDCWTEAESSQFFQEALAIERAAGVKVAHETHRGRILFNPWITSRMVERFAGLSLCCDFSHWVCVAERLLDEQADGVAACAPRAIHLHARVGYEQGPQVPDPRAPEYAAHLAAHERWWKLVWQAQAENKRALSTLTPEFGPPQYQHTLPFTKVPVSDLWEICNWVAHRQLENFSVWAGRRRSPR